MGKSTHGSHAASRSSGLKCANGRRSPTAVVAPKYERLALYQSSEADRSHLSNIQTERRVGHQRKAVEVRVYDNDVMGWEMKYTPAPRAYRTTPEACRVDLYVAYPFLGLSSRYCARGQETLVDPP